MSGEVPSHYEVMAIEPMEYIHANKLDFFEGSAVKYVSRWRRKNGIEDLKKAIHCIQRLIEFETSANPEVPKQV